MQAQNIGPKGCRRRIRTGTAILTASGVYLLLLLIFRAGMIFWVPVLVSTFIGLIYFLQAVEKTCILLAKDGVHLLDDTNKQKIQDNELARALRDKSTRLVVKAVLLTSLLFLFYFLVPKN